MPANRQQGQHNPLTCTNTGQHAVRTRQHRQQNNQHPLTPLTPADTSQRNESAGQRIALTALTLTAARPAPQPHARGGQPLMRREPHLKLVDLLSELGMSRAAFYRMRARGQAPKSIRLPNGQLRFRRADIDKWLQDHEEAIAC